MADYSFEVFPPKSDEDFAKAYELLKRLDKLSPSLISVTYGAGGSNSKKTLELVRYIKEHLSADALAHITCVNSSKEELEEQDTALCAEATLDSDLLTLIRFSLVKVISSKFFTFASAAAIASVSVDFSKAVLAASKSAAACAVSVVLVG